MRLHLTRSMLGNTATLVALVVLALWLLSLQGKPWPAITPLSQPRIAAAIANGDHQHQQIRPLFGNLRKDLDKVERPVLPRVLLGIGQAVVPGLEFIQQ